MTGTPAPDWPRPAREQLAELVGDRRQLASVRQVELRDGAEAGVRALVFSTGGGLDFWVLQDRSFDIGALSWRGLPLAWQHPAGFARPGLHAGGADGGTGIERSLGGFLVTCGLDNARQPQDGLPLHGSLPFTPARLTACGEDWEALTPVLYAEGEVTDLHLSRGGFRLTRRIEAPIAGSRLSITDRVENVGPAPAEMRVLYHMNLGFPAIGRGTRVALDGAPVALAEAGAGSGEPGVDCHPAGGADGLFRVDLARPRSGQWPGLALRLEGPSGALPFVQFWRDSRPRRNVLGIEPSNCARNEDGTSGPGTRLAPGESWSARLDITFTQPEDSQSPARDGEETWQPSH
jgi:hypothetical protein